MDRTASTPLQALAIPAGVVAVLIVLAGFVSGVDTSRAAPAVGPGALMSSVQP